MGVPYETFWHLTPSKLNCFAKAQEIRRRIQDESMWYMGVYVQHAVGVAVEHCLNGKKAKSEYFPRPLLADAIGKTGEERALTEEEKIKEQERQFSRMLVMQANFKKA